MEKVSIIIPVFNRGEFVSCAIDSVLNQSYDNYELILVDDGSEDYSLEIMNCYRNKYPDKIKVISQRNSGPSVARNTGIRSASGELIAFLDSDDKWASQKLEKQVKLHETIRNISFSYTGYCKTDKYFNLIKEFIPDINIIGHIYEKLWLCNNDICGGTVMVEKRIIEDVGMFDENLIGAENLDLRIKLSKKGPVFSCDEILYYYRLHETNRVGDREKVLACHHDLVNKYFGVNGEENKALWKKVMANLTYKMAMSKFDTMKLREAGMLFLRALAYNPKKVDCYVGIMKCLMGENINRFFGKRRARHFL